MAQQVNQPPFDQVPPMGPPTVQQAQPAQIIQPTGPPIQPLGPGLPGQPTGQPTGQPGQSLLAGQETIDPYTPTDL